MAHLVLVLFGSEDVFSNYGLWGFLSIGAIALFGIFIPAVTWMDSRRKEREAFYKAETFRRIIEAPGEGAKAALELLREEDRLKRQTAREGLKMGGIVNIFGGIGLAIFLRVLTGSVGVSLCGVLAVLIGVGLLVYVYVLAPPV
jgi:Flp pilus assembly protein TadB